MGGLIDDKIVKRIKLKVKDCQLNIRVKIAPNYVINTNQSDLLSGKYRYGFFKLKNSRRNTFEFFGPGGDSLYDKLKNPISEYDAFLIMEQIVDTIRKIKKVGLSRSNLLLDIKYIFFNSTTKELTFIYLPIASPHGGKDVLEVVEQVLYSMNLTETDSNSLANFSYFIKKLDKFDADKIEAYIYKVHEDIVDLIKKEDINDIFKHETVKNNRSVQKQGESEKDDEKTEIMSDDEKTELMSANDWGAGQIDNYGQAIFQTGRNRAVGIVNDESTCMVDEEATVLLDDEKTELFTDEGKPSYGFPILIRTQTDEVIRINKSVFRI